MRKKGILLLVAVMMLSACSASQEQTDQDVPFNTIQVHYYSENDDYRFENHPEDPFYVDKATGKQGYLIKDCFYDMHRSDDRIASIFPYHDLVYYLKESMQYGYEMVEVETEHFQERVVYRETESRMQKQNFLGIGAAIHYENLNPIVSFFVAGDTLFLIRDDGVYQKPLSSMQKPQRIITCSPTSLSYYDGTIFYLDSDLQLCAYQIKEQSTKILVQTPCMWVAVSETYLFYSNLSEHGTVYVMDFNGQNNRLFLDIAVQNMSVDATYLYFANPEDHNYLYRIRQDGTDKQLLCKRECFVIDALADRICFLSHSDEENAEESLQYYAVDQNGNEIAFDHFLE